MDVLKIGRSQLLLIKKSRVSGCRARRASDGLITRAATSIGTPLAAKVQAAASHPILGSSIKVRSSRLAVGKSMRSVIAAA